MRRVEHRVCVTCHKSDSPYMAKGQCKRCYLKAYRENPANRERIAASKGAWARAFHAAGFGKVVREQRFFSGNREAALKRDGYRCVRCGEKKDLVVHHKDHHGRGNPQADNRLENLETLCHSCHLAEHRQETLEARRKRHATPKLNKSGRWSTKYEACISCGRTDSPHSSRGLCNRCNVRRYVHKMT